jgi:hypothetical protein
MAKLEYRSGNILSISALDNSPMLFMEWLSNHSNVFITKIILRSEDLDNTYFEIRLNATKVQFLSALNYINSNL